MVCESGSWAGSIVKPHSLQNTGDPVCVGLFSTDIWCWHDCDDNMEQRVNQVQFVLEDSPAVSSVHLKPLGSLYSDIFYSFFSLFTLRFGVQASCASLNHAGESKDSLTAAFLSSYVSAVSTVSESKTYFDTAASCSTLTPDKREHGPTGVRTCPVVSEHPGSGPGQVVPRRQTGHLQLWALRERRALRDLSHTRGE